MIHKRYLAGMFLVLSMFLGRAHAYDSADYYKAGLQLYNQKNFTQAIQYFNAALRFDPRHVGSLMGRGNCYYAMGQYTEALSDYQSAQAISPSDPLARMIQYLQGKAGPASMAGSMTTPTPVPRISRPKPPKKSARIFASMQPLSLSDFTANAQANLAAARDSQPSDPSIQYTGVVPTTSPHLGVEADYPLSKEFEGGLSVGILPMGTASDDISDGSGDSLTDSYQITAASIGVVGRFFVLDGDFKPWVAAGPLVVPVNVDYKYDYEVPSFSYSVSFAGPFNGFGLGVQAQLGIDIQVFDSVSFSVFGGYLVASANNLQGTLGQVSNIPNVTTGSGVELDVVPTPEGNVIVPVSNGYLCVPTYGYNAGDKAPSGTRPAVVDMSGPLAGISVDIYW